MVDRVTKALRKLSAKERKNIKQIIRQMKSGDKKGLDIKKLKGNAAIYRVRKADLRIIYQVSRQGDVSILAIERRSDKTYSKF